MSSRPWGVESVGQVHHTVHAPSLIACIRGTHGSATDAFTALAALTGAVNAVQVFHSRPDVFRKEIDYLLTY